jgi:RNA polymerase sigma-70 factor (ECF subfamily)
MPKDYQELSLEEKMSLSQDGDNVAYEILLTELSKIIRGYLFKKIATSGEVEDVMQEILISIHKARHTFDANRPLIPWVMSITKFRLNDYFRKHYGSVLKGAVGLSEIEEITSDDVTFDDDSSELLSIVMERLPERQRIIVRLMKIEGYTAKEVGGQLDMSVSAVKVSAHRAYKILKSELEKLENEN